MLVAPVAVTTASVRGVQPLMPPNPTQRDQPTMAHWTAMVADEQRNCSETWLSPTGKTA